MARSVQTNTVKLAGGRGRDEPALSGSVQIEPVHVYTGNKSRSG